MRRRELLVMATAMMAARAARAQQQAMPVTGRSLDRHYIGAK
jgi:hypothetical protein